MTAGVFATMTVVVLEMLLFFPDLRGGKHADRNGKYAGPLARAGYGNVSGPGCSARGHGPLRTAFAGCPVYYEVGGLPALLLILAVGVAFLNVGVVRLILKRLGDDSVSWIKPFTQWTLPPPYFGLVFLFGLALTLAGQMIALPAPLLFLGINTFLIVFQAYLVLGLAVVWHYFKAKNVGRFFAGAVHFVFVYHGNLGHAGCLFRSY